MQNTAEEDMGEEGTQGTVLEPAGSSEGSDTCQDTGNTWEETNEGRWRALLGTCALTSSVCTVGAEGEH